jgi:tetratricopeptide (TPR) repeat protein
LRRRAELAGELGEAAAAAELWRRYLAVETAPAARADAELVLARTLAEDLGDVVGAIEQVERVIAQRPSELPLRERLVGLATQAGDWPRVMRELREIARQRPGAAERARDELRLGRVARDHGRDPDEALAAFERGRQLDPQNLDVLRDQVELAASQRPSARADYLARGIDDLRRAIDATPDAFTLYDRLATVFGWAGDRDGQWLALVGLEALGRAAARAARADRRRARAAAAAAVPAAPRRRDPRGAAPPSAGGVAAELWRALAPAVTAALAIDPAKLGFVRGDRIALKALGKKYEGLAAALAASASTTSSSTSAMPAPGRRGCCRPTRRSCAAAPTSPLAPPPGPASPSGARPAGSPTRRPRWPS